MDNVDADFWPPELSSIIRSPKTVLEPRALELGARTKGVLNGTVASVASKDNNSVIHYFRVTVPALGSYSVDILGVRHYKNRFYPCYVDAVCFHGEYYDDDGQSLGYDNEASSEEDLYLLLRKAIRSTEIASLLYSLVAQANEAVHERLAGERLIAEKKRLEMTRLLRDKLKNSHRGAEEAGPADPIGEDPISQNS